MTYNLDLMRAVREQITKHPETHDQHTWAMRTECGTTHCIAGWACALSGEVFEWEPVDEEEEPEEPVVLEVASWVGTKDVVTGIDARARELLGLDNFEAGRIFWAMSNKAALTHLDELIQKGESAA